MRTCMRVCVWCFLRKICEIATIVKSSKTILNYAIHKARPCSIIVVVIYNIHIQLKNREQYAIHIIQTYTNYYINRRNPGNMGELTFLCNSLLCIGQTHQNTRYGIVLLLTSVCFDKYELSHFTRKCPILPANFLFYPHIRVKWDFDPGNMGCIFSCVIR